MITPDIIDKTDKKVRLRVLLLSAILFFLCAASLFYILRLYNTDTKNLTAYIYQEGNLLEAINLSSVTTPYSFTVSAPDGGYNTIEVRKGAIGITDADCPDTLCVSMGYADSSLLPLVCLPHALVIQVVETSDTEPDVLSY